MALAAALATIRQEKIHKLYVGKMNDVDVFPLYGSQPNLHKITPYEVKQLNDYLPEMWHKYLRPIIVEFTPYRADEGYYCTAEVGEYSNYHKSSKKSATLIKSIVFPLKDILFDEHSDEYEHLQEIEDVYRFALQAHLCHERAAQLRALFEHNYDRDWPDSCRASYDKISKICDDLSDDVESSRVDVIKLLTSDNEKLLKIYEYLEKEHIASEAQKIITSRKGTD